MKRKEELKQVMDEAWGEMVKAGKKSDKAMDEQRMAEFRYQKTRAEWMEEPNGVPE